MGIILKCRKCRHELIRDTSQSAIVSAHGQTLHSQTHEPCCSSVDQDSLWFLDESSSPWVSDIISKHEWTKGKLNCPNCEARIGSFDFVSTSKCVCGSAILPPVHFVRSKVDSPQV